VDASTDRLEEALHDVASNPLSEVRSFLVGVAEVEAREDAGPVDILDHVVKRSYTRVVPVIRLSRVNVTLSVPKNEVNASATAALWQAWAEGYSGKFGGR